MGTDRAKTETKNGREYYCFTVRKELQEKKQKAKFEDGDLTKNGLENYRFTSGNTLQEKKFEATAPGRRTARSSPRGSHLIGG